MPLLQGWLRHWITLEDWYGIKLKTKKLNLDTIHTIKFKNTQKVRPCIYIYIYISVCVGFVFVFSCFLHALSRKAFLDAKFLVDVRVITADVVKRPEAKFSQHVNKWKRRFSKLFSPFKINTLTFFFLGSRIKIFNYTPNYTYADRTDTRTHIRI